jgi:hypothetical protein
MSAPSMDSTMRNAIDASAVSAPAATYSYANNIGVLSTDQKGGRSFPFEIQGVPLAFRQKASSHRIGENVLGQSVSRSRRRFHETSCERSAVMH